MPIHLHYDCAPLAALTPLPAKYCRNQQGILCHISALAAINTLFTAAHAAAIFPIIISGFRDIAHQKRLFDDAVKRHGENATRWVAPPGYSEHHTGFAFDFSDLNFPEYDDEDGFETTPAGVWIATNAPLFGFNLSFPKNNSQGIGYEPWHWRFINEKIHN